MDNRKSVIFCYSTVKKFFLKWESVRISRWCQHQNLPWISVSLDSRQRGQVHLQWHFSSSVPFCQKSRPRPDHRSTLRDPVAKNDQVLKNVNWIVWKNQFLKKNKRFGMNCSTNRRMVKSTKEFPVDAKASCVLMERPRFRKNFAQHLKKLQNPISEN